MNSEAKALDEVMQLLETSRIGIDELMAVTEAFARELVSIDEYGPEPFIVDEKVLSDAKEYLDWIDSNEQ